MIEGHWRCLRYAGLCILYTGSCIYYALSSVICISYFKIEVLILSVGNCTPFPGSDKYLAWPQIFNFCSLLYIPITFISQDTFSCPQLTKDSHIPRHKNLSPPPPHERVVGYFLLPLHPIREGWTYSFTCSTNFWNLSNL